ncbi:hypothetical protein HZA38_00110 [Candidatus Peregrinibacteria bacterium]|nr:hypothetical protein [Candidatus Peregrinibacteria bacterium]
MIAISVRELRENFPEVATRLKNKETFLLIYNSVPIAEIRPTQMIQTFAEATEKDVEIANIQDVGEDFLDKEELKYYLSLKRK